MVKQRTPAAVLWDLDGTLLDTEPYWMIAEANLVHEFNGTWSESDGLELVGSGLLSTAKKLQSRGVLLEPDEIVRRLTESVLWQSQASIPWRPGALELLLQVRESGTPTALVTMSMRPMASFVANSSATTLFDVLVTGEDVQNPKPFPDAYLLAANQLGVDPGECIVLEDSIPGIISAKQAGTKVIGVPAHVDLSEFEDLLIWETLEGKSFRNLVEVASEAFATRGPR
ncbi:MAG: HAD family phosphatase [Cryobacterium sp.]|nr:HAD family phosphatase [Cryobacterium sp.]